MKRLIVALVASVAVSAAFAKLTDTQSFEESFSDFVPSIVDEDASELVGYDSDEPAFPAPYDFADFGSKYLSLDTGDATLWRTNAGDAAYFDMAMQFNPCASAPEIDEDTKIAVYLNSDSNLVVLAGTELGDGTSTNLTGVQLAPGTWGRLTIAASANQFTVTLNTNTVVGTYYSRKLGDTTIKQVGFKGTGALDDFVARTTDPFIQNPAVMIGGEGYASIQDALTDAGASSVIELLANNADAVTLGEGESLKLKLGEYAYTGTITLPDGYVLGTPTTADGVTTYSQVEGVAAVALRPAGVRQPDVWYATFDEAYAVAYEAGLTTMSDLKVKVGGDFAPVNIPGPLNFYDITFVATTEGPISISMQNGGNYFTAINSITFPENATLTLPVSGGIYNITGGTLNIPANVVLTIHNTTALNGITGLTGSGTIKNGFQGAYNLVYYYNAKLPTLLRNSAWHGTLELSGSSATAPDATDWWDMEIAKFANANSKVRFNGFTTRLYSSGHGSVPVELVGDGLTVVEETAGGRTYDIGGVITGSGSLAVTGGGTALTTLKFSGDTSAFAGSISFGNDANACVVFGTGDKTVASAKAIEVLSGASVSVGSGATWTASNLTVGGTLGVAGTLTATGTATVNDGAAVNVTGALVTSSATPTVNNGASLTIATGGTWTIPTGGAVVHGVLTVDGNVVDTADAVGKIYSNQGTGKIIANSANACALGNASTWRGTFVIGWNPTGAFNPNNYGNHVSDTVVLTKDLADNAYFGPGGGAALTINPTIKLEADVTIKNGFSAVSDTYLVTFTKLTGDYNFTTSQGGGSEGGQPKVRYYAITTLDNFNGKLTVPSSSVLRIGTVNVTNGTDLTGCIVSADCQAGTPAGTIPGYPALTVAGVDSGKLVYNGSAATSGFYRAKIQSGDDYYLSIADAIADSKTTVTLLADSNEDFVLPADGSMQIVAGDFTYGGTPTTAEGYRVAYDDATGTYTSSAIPYVAQVGATKYETLEAAIAAATAGQTVVVLADCTVTEAITFNYGITLSNDFVVTHSVNADSASKGYAFRFANGDATANTPVTVVGTGSFVNSSGVGSAFLVGNNETYVDDTKEGKGKHDYGMDAPFAGYLIMKGCTLDGASGNVVKAEYGKFVMDAGSIVAGANRGVKADADAGSYTVEVVINGGSISSTKTGDGNGAIAASAESADGTATVVVNGGEITGAVSAKTASQNGTRTITIPGTSTAQFDRNQTTFCETGYGTKESGDWYVVAPLSAIAFISGEGSTTNDYSIFNGDAVTPPTAAEIVGKSFSAWNPSVVSPAAGNATYTAQYTNNVYMITFDANGGSVDPATTNFTIESGAITLPTPTGLMGVTFGGWTNETYETPITEFTPAAGTLGNITLFAQWNQSGNPQTIDQSSETPTATFAAESVADATNKVSLVTPDGVDAAAYKSNFDFSATPNGDGTYTVTLTGIKEEVKTDVSEDAVDVLTSASGTGNVEVPAGLYYRITRYTAIGTPVSEKPATGQSDGTGVEVTKPGVTQGFIQVELGTAPFAAE